MINLSRSIFAKSVFLAFIFFMPGGMLLLMLWSIKRFWFDRSKESKND